jgi:hypothetical protein
LPMSPGVIKITVGPLLRNRLSEVWGLMRDWFHNGNVEIPDDPELNDRRGCPYVANRKARRIWVSVRKLLPKDTWVGGAEPCWCLESGEPAGQSPKVCSDSRPAERLCAGKRAIYPDSRPSHPKLKNPSLREKSAPRNKLVS